MKTQIIMFSTLIGLIAASPVLAMDYKKEIVTEARAAADSILQNDFETAAKYTHPKIIEEIGGKEKMIQLLKKGGTQMQQQGVTIESVDIGEPFQIKEAGDLVSALVPESVHMKIPKGHLTSESQLIAVSENKGKSWYFIDAAPLTTESLNEFLPAIAGNITLPEKKGPVFTPDEEVK